MALKQDYILKIIEEVINVLVNSIKDDQKDVELLNDVSNNPNKKLCYLVNLVEKKQINEAENYLFDDLNLENIEDFEIGMLFFKYLNEKDDDFLEKSNYSREEITEGISDLAKQYGFGDFIEMFMKS